MSLTVGLSEYQALKQQFDELLQALYVENVHSNRNGYFIPNTERILELNGRGTSPYEKASREVTTDYEILKQERDKYRKVLDEIVVKTDNGDFKCSVISVIANEALK